MDLAWRVHSVTDLKASKALGGGGGGGGVSVGSQAGQSLGCLFIIPPISQSCFTLESGDYDPLS